MRDLENKIISKKIALLITSQEKLTKGGPSIRIFETAKFLKDRHGLNINIIEPSADFTKYDIIHIFNVWPYNDTLENLIKAYSTSIKIVFSPIYMPLNEFRIINPQVMDIVRSVQGNIDKTSNEINLLYKNKINHRSLKQGPEEINYISKMSYLSDHLIYLSSKEKESFISVSNSNKKNSILYNPVKELWINKSIKSFSKEYSLHKFVLCVGRIEPRKNQLLLSIAMKSIDLTLVLIGNCVDMNYYKMIIEYGTKNILILNHIDHTSGLLNSAYLEASVFCLPSWIEGAPLSALEAASFGCPMVLSNRSSEREYFENYALYCDPSNPIDIRDKLIMAYNSSIDKDSLSQMIRAKYSYSNHVDNLKHIYEELL